MSEATRAWIYRILTAVGVVAVFYGFVSQEEVVVWLALAVQILSTGGNALAVAHTTTK